jgi:protein TonB
VLTAPETRGAESDPLDFTVVQGSASRYAGGVTAATGTSDKAVRDPGARGGTLAPRTLTRPGPGGGGKLPPAPQPVVPKAPSKRRFARPVSESWNCSFPPEADASDVHYARVLVVVTVRVDGSPSSAAVLSDPGFGFAAAARRCALGQRYTVAWDDAGRATAGRTPPFTVTFTR